MGRVYALYKVWKNADSRERAFAEVGLRRLILGEEGMILDKRQTGVLELWREFEAAALRSTLQQPNADVMGNKGHLSLPREPIRRWIVDSDNLIKGRAPVSPSQIMKERNCADLYKLRPNVCSSDLQIYTAARIDVMERCKGSGRSFNCNAMERAMESI